MRNGTKARRNRGAVNGSYTKRGPGRRHLQGGKPK